jgi:hypothetical protein
MSRINGKRWSIDEADEWLSKTGWIVGCNFIPSTASNQIEMWSEKTFDRETIKRELGWARNIGLNSVRVYLHDLVWEHERDGFISRIHEFLDIADGSGLTVLPVIFDDCWDRNPVYGDQKDPVPGVHNSRWVESPGMKKVKNRLSWPGLEAYVRDIITEFGSDKRIVMWDVYNEVGNTFLPSLSKPQPVKSFELAVTFFGRIFLKNMSIELLKKTFEWARSCSPEQPLTSSIWFRDNELNSYLMGEADIISFHNYRDVKNLKKQISDLKKSGRPVVCTEYMARTSGSRFETHLPVFKNNNVGCYSWGLAAGKTQTHFSWQSGKGSSEPELWFHDILRPDGTAYIQEEVEFIRNITGTGR